MQQFRYRYMRGQRIGGRYKLQEPLGYGGFAEVWKAEDERMRRVVAAKFIHASLVNRQGEVTSEQEEELRQQFIARFGREIQIAGDLSYGYSKPYLLDIHDTNQDEYGNLYYVMDYVPGPLLLKEIESYMGSVGLLVPNQPAPAANQPPQRRLSKSVFPLFDVYRILDQLLDVLGYLHANSVIHRDIKPENIKLPRDSDGRPSIRLLDFGIAKKIKDAMSKAHGGRQLTQQGMWMGSPGYMPIELFGKVPVDQAGRHWEVGPYTDLYAVATILFFAVTGRLPYEIGSFPHAELARELADFNSPVSDPGLLVEDLNPLLRAVMLKGLAKEPWMRYQDAAVMRNDLREAEKTDRARLRISADFSPVIIRDEEAMPLSHQPTVSAGGQSVSVDLTSLDAAAREPAPMAGQAGADRAVPAAERTRTTLKSVADDEPPPQRKRSLSLWLAVSGVLLGAVAAFLTTSGRWNAFFASPDSRSAPTAVGAESAPSNVSSSAIPSREPSVSPATSATAEVIAVSALPAPSAGRRQAEPPTPAALQAFNTGRMIATGPVKDCKGALPFFEQARKASPNWPEVYAAIGECQRKLGQSEAAKESFRIHASFAAAPR